MGARVLFIVKELEGAEPLGALYVAACLQRAGHECRFVGTRGRDVAAEVRSFQPGVVAFGATTGLHQYYLGLAAHLKRQFPRVTTLLGGPHATYFPDVIHSPGLDVICRGEGEAAAVELCDALDQGGDPRRIRDLWVKHEGLVHRNPPRPLQQDLDELPFPARELLWEYDDRLRQRPLKSFTANRGCPYPCSYCFNGALVEHYGPAWKRVRARSPQNVVSEISLVRSKGPLQIVGFRESIFAHGVKWLRAFAGLYRAQIGLPYYCHVRADAITAEMVDLLAGSGCHSVNVGIETASQRLANEVLDRRGDLEALTQGIRRLKRAGLVVFADNMVGIPGGTFADDLATLRLNIALDVDYAAATLCTPYPGTKLARYAREHGYFSGEFDAFEESYYTRSVLRFSSEDERRKIENLHKLFALTAAAPGLLPLVERLVRLPPNDWFYAAFRAYYYLSHVTQVLPRQPSWDELSEGVQAIFGRFRGGDPNRYPAPAPQPLPYAELERPPDASPV